MKPRILRALIRTGLFGYGAALRVVRVAAPRRAPSVGNGLHVLLTGAFESDAWVEHHLLPIARSGACTRITMVATTAIQPVDKITVVCPPQALQRLLGSAAARLLMFGWVAMRDRPDIVGGFHLLFNGLAAALLAPLAGARSLYFSVGGPMEIVDGGIWAENKLFNKLGAPDPVIERQLGGLVRGFDIVITMGTRSAQFLRERGATGEIHVIPGGVDADTYRPSAQPPVIDLIFVGRLAPIKQLPLLLQAVHLVKEQVPTVSLTIVGEGELRQRLEASVRALGLASNVRFAGQRDDVSELVSRARMFVLTSKTEGVSLSLMEAFACGVPAVVTDVGDLADVVTDGVSGFLVADGSAERFAARVVELLRDEPLRRRFAVEALRASGTYRMDAITRRWD